MLSFEVIECSKKIRRDAWNDGQYNQSRARFSTQIIWGNKKLFARLLPDVRRPGVNSGPRSLDDCVECRRCSVDQSNPLKARIQADVLISRQQVRTVSGFKA